MNKHFMIDIETTGVNLEEDKILQVGIVEMEYRYPFWFPTGRSLERTLHYPGQPVSDFAKEHMSALYKKCNETDKKENYEVVGYDIRDFIHQKTNDPKYFIGWNASNFDMPFMFKSGMLKASYYGKNHEGKEVLCGDAHYRIYEQTGSLQLAIDSTGLSRDSIKQLAEDLNPVKIDLPKGKAHDALYDCYWQINMQNGLIAILRNGIKK